VERLFNYKFYGKKRICKSHGCEGTTLTGCDLHLPLTYSDVVVDDDDDDDACCCYSCWRSCRFFSHKSTRCWNSMWVQTFTLYNKY